MMAMNNMSSSQAVLAMYIDDTEVYDQERILPLSMQKKYQTELSLVKKLKRRVSEAIGATAEISIENKADENESKESEGTEKNIENEIDENEIEDIIMNETEEK